jgi:hypothetical protein
MSVMYGSVQSGFAVSSSFMLGRANRLVYVNVGSYAPMAWYATFTIDGAGQYARPVLDQAAQGFASAIFSGTNAGFGLVPYPPTATMRIETATNVTATTSFAIIEVAAGR